MGIKVLDGSFLFFPSPYGHEEEIPSPLFLFLFRNAQDLIHKKDRLKKPHLGIGDVWLQKCSISMKTIFRFAFSICCLLCSARGKGLCVCCCNSNPYFCMHIAEKGGGRPGRQNKYAIYVKQRKYNSPYINFHGIYYHILNGSFDFLESKFG